MAQTAEFEEKEYEQPLNWELLFDARNLLWTPGQVFEEHFGIDAALFADDPRLWILFGYPDIPQGVVLDNFRWGHIWKKTQNKRQLPTFKTNLLLQTKRPEHRLGMNATYAKHGIKGQYWQFRITHHQQEALERLHQRINNRALICYASAAFHTHADLYSHITNHMLVDNSTFVQAHRMSTHSKWVYNQAGAIGLACSKISKVEGINFRSLLATSSAQNNESDDIRNNLLQLEKAALTANEELSETNPLRNEFLRRMKMIGGAMAGIQRSRNSSVVRAFLNFSSFCYLANINWFPIGRE